MANRYKNIPRQTCPCCKSKTSSVIEDGDDDLCPICLNPFITKDFSLIGLITITLVVGAIVKLLIEVL